MIEKAYLEYRLEKSQNFLVSRDPKRVFIVEYQNFPKFKGTGHSIDEAFDQLQNTIRKNLENLSIWEIDLFFDKLNQTNLVN